MVDLGIVILNWNTRDLLRRCLTTVLASQGAFSYRVIVVDNLSADGSADMVRAEFPSVEVIVSPANHGFSFGNNLGLRAFGFHGPGDVAADAPRYALLLNPDTEVPPDALHRMVQFMDAHPSVGAAGPRLVLADGTLDKACKRGFPTPMVALYHFSGLGKLFPRSKIFGRYNMTFIDEHEEAEVDSVVGAFMLVRREALRDVGLLDETFFMYGEDLDWALRMKRAGWSIRYHPAVTVLHVKRAASRQSARAQFEFWRAMLIFYRKHYRRSTPLPLHALILAGLLVKGGRPLWREIRRPSPLAQGGMG
ncbi:MAG: glycosyltransferase [Anaerolinea sp.]|nr:glycosyltransferase [Anaerolinea sp.]